MTILMKHLNALNYFWLTRCKINYYFRISMYSKIIVTTYNKFRNQNDYYPKYNEGTSENVQATTPKWNEASR